MKKLFTIICLAGSLGATAQIANGVPDLFFSEYIEGSSNNKALEIYNPTPVTVNLSDYTVEIYSNGSATPTNTLVMTGMLAPSDVFVIANSNADPQILSVADTTSAVSNFNGNDAVVLKKNGVDIDIIGQVGFNPGASWVVGTGSTLDYTLVRDSSITSPETDWTISVNQWVVYPQNTFNYLGSHFVISSVEENPEWIHAITVFPNPSSGEFTVNWSRNINKGRIIIQDICGKIVYESKLDHVQEAAIDYSLVTGLYVLVVSDDEKGIMNESSIVIR